VKRRLTGPIVGAVFLALAVPARSDEPLEPPHRITQCSPNTQYCAEANVKRLKALAVVIATVSCRTDTPTPKREKKAHRLPPDAFHTWRVLGR
jgi:hypothetical protein